MGRPMGRQPPRAGAFSCNVFQRQPGRSPDAVVEDAGGRAVGIPQRRHQGGAQPRPRAARQAVLHQKAAQRVAALGLAPQHAQHLLLHRGPVPQRALRPVVAAAGLRGEAGGGRRQGSEAA